MTLEEILAALKKLSEEDKQKALSALSAKENESDEKEGELATAEGTESAEAVADETTPLPPTNTADTVAEEAVAEGESTTKKEQSEAIVDEPIPDMAKAEQPSADLTQEPAVEPTPVQQAQPSEQVSPVMDEQGGELPVDYQQVIDGLNAKTLALEAENKQLKAKIEGAFGLSSKPGGFAAVNSLYSSDISDIPQMRK